MELDELIKGMLNDLPKKNSQDLKTYTLNLAVMERLNSVQESYNYNESKIFELLSNEKLDIKSIIRSAKESSKLMLSGSNIIEKLLNNTEL